VALLRLVDRVAEAKGELVVVAAEKGKSQALRCPAHHRLATLILVAASLAISGVGSAAPASEAAGPAAETVSAPASIRVRGRTVLELQAEGPSGATPSDRARAASTILAAVLGEGGEQEVQVSSLDGSRDHLLVQVGKRELLRLGPADVAASGLNAEVYGESVRARLQSFLREERHRSRIRELVLSVCMVVLLGLLSFLALRWIHDQRQHLRRWLERKAQTGPAERARSMLVLSREGFESLAYVLATLTALLAQLALSLSYIVFVLSQFEVTRGWIEPLLQMLFNPFVDLLRRLAHFLPSVVVLVITFYAVMGGVRLLRFFLNQVATGHLTIGWLPADLAMPLRPLLEGGLALLALLAVSPLLAGSHEDLLTRIGVLAVGALLLASLPVGATIVVGVFAVVSRRYAVGQWLEIGSQSGELTEVTFFELRLVPIDAGMIHIPHLRTLFVPVRQLVGPPPLELDLSLAASVAPAKAMEVIAHAVPEQFGKAEVSLRSLDGSAAMYRLRLPAIHLARRAELLVLIATALAGAGIAPAGVVGPERQKL
jgi:hypothetical protein